MGNKKLDNVSALTQMEIDSIRLIDHIIVGGATVVIVCGKKVVFLDREV